MERRFLVILFILFIIAFPFLSASDPRVSYSAEDTVEYPPPVHRVLLVVTTTSDWTTVYLRSGASIAGSRVDVLEGGDAAEFRYDVSVAENYVAVGKRAFDTTKVRVEAYLIVFDVAEEKPVVVEIQKGDIGQTMVEIYNFNEDKPNRVSTLKNTQTGKHPNAKKFSVTATSITSGGPLRLDLKEKFPKLVWAFYYPWYNKEDWFRPWMIDKPLIGPYSSADRTVIERHVKMAKSAGIDGFIVSWWGPGNEIDRNLRTILEVASQNNFEITIYLESLNGTGQPRTKSDLEGMLRGFFFSYEKDQRYYRLRGLPVIFVWAVDSQPSEVWRDVIETIRKEGHNGFYVAMTGNPTYLKIFDGIHIYGPTWQANLTSFYHKLSLSSLTYPLLYPETQKETLWAATISPGYDDRLLPGREGTCHPREEGETYKKTFSAAIDSDPDWVLITSFNEWWENTHIEPSEKYGWKYLDLTALFSSNFKRIKLLPNLSLSKMINATTVKVGEIIVVTVTITNLGEGLAIDIECAETIPESFSLLNESSRQFDRLLANDTAQYHLVLKANTTGTFNLPSTIVNFKDIYDQAYTARSQTLTVNVEEMRVSVQPFYGTAWAALGLGIITTTLIVIASVRLRRRKLHRQNVGSMMGTDADLYRRSVLATSREPGVSAAYELYFTPLFGALTIVTAVVLWTSRRKRS